MRKMLASLLAGVLLLSGCTAQAAAKSDDTAAVAQQPAENAAVQGGFTKNQTLDGADGIIHFSYYLPDGYDSAKTYPLIVAMPGYGEMWFGEDSAGSNLRWNGVQAWTKLSEPVILVSGQLTDWGAKSARQANELAEYMIDQLLQLNIPDNAYFNAKGIYNYHGGGSVVFDDENVLNWVLAQRKSTGKDDNNEKDEATSDGGHGGSAGDRSDSDGPGGRGYL